MAAGAGMYENGSKGRPGERRRRPPGRVRRGSMTKPKTQHPAGAPRGAQAFMARLRLDHARLSRVLREMEVQRTRLGSEPAAARAVLSEALRYLVEYLHGHHHP